jgi:DNA-binding CsgD family transcriptional regulator
LFDLKQLKEVDSMRYLQCLQWFKNEKVQLWILLILNAIALLGDLIGDMVEDGFDTHVKLEFAIMLFTFIVSDKLVVDRFRYKIQAKNLSQQLKLSHEELRIFKEKNEQAIQSLSRSIEDQFNDWRFTDAEKEIASLLLKGLSHKEIAELRKTSEQTVRQQSSVIYSKSKLAGRTEFSAYFLEDLLPF